MTKNLKIKEGGVSHDKDFKNAKCLQVGGIPLLSSIQCTLNRNRIFNV